MNYHLEILPIHETNEDKKKRQTVENPTGATVLVHGICHGAWCWENFINFFADHGHQCYAISLPGHAGSEGKEHLQEYRLSDYVEAVKEAMKTIKEDMAVHGLRDVKPFLLGHSMGGAVVQQYIGKYEDDVQGAILFAPATAPKMSSEDSHRSSPRNLSYAALIAQFGIKFGFIVRNAAFFTGRDGQGEPCQRVKNTTPYKVLFQKESKKITGTITKDGDLNQKYSENYEVDIPIFVIGSYADLYFGEDSLKQTADAYAENGKTALVILDRLCHDMMLDDYEPNAWEASAKPVLEFVENPLKFVDDPKYHWPRKN